MPDWTGKTRGGVAGYKIFVFLLKYFGVSFAYFILRFVVIYFLLFAPRATKASWHFFRKRLGYSPFKSLRYISKTFYKLGQVLIDKTAFLSGLSKKFTFDFDGEEHLRKMANETGGVLIGAHAGSWEIAGHLLERLNTKINIVMFADEHEKIQDFLSEIYTDQNVNFILIGKEGYSHLFQISEALKNKELIAIHGDRYLPGSNTISKEFFNEFAEFPTGPFIIPLKFDVPVCYVTAMKESSKHYHFYASVPKKFPATKNPANRLRSVNQIMDAYINNLENILLKYPDQWFNFYDFWGVKDGQGQKTLN
jgi:predicted LPLAT superfamily acyltransferase